MYAQCAITYLNLQVKPSTTRAHEYTCLLSEVKNQGVLLLSSNTRFQQRVQTQLQPKSNTSHAQQLHQQLRIASNPSNTYSLWRKRLLQKTSSRQINATQSLVPALVAFPGRPPAFLSMVAMTPFPPFAFAFPPRLLVPPPPLAPQPSSSSLPGSGSVRAARKRLLVTSRSQLANLYKLS